MAVAALKPKQNKKAVQGFTLIELMITLVVLAILVALAAPNFQTMLLNNRSQAQAEEIIAALQFARAEAVKRGDMVSVCSSVDGASCGGDWTDGFLVFADSALSDTAAATVLASPDDVLKYVQIDSEDAVINIAGGTFVRFLSTGTRAMVGGAQVVFQSHVTGCEGNRQVSITIGVAGSIRGEKGACP